MKPLGGSSESYKIRKDREKNKSKSVWTVSGGLPETSRRTKMNWDRVRIESKDSIWINSGPSSRSKSGKLREKIENLGMSGASIPEILRACGLHCPGPIVVTPANAGIVQARHQREREQLMKLIRDLHVSDQVIKKLRLR